MSDPIKHECGIALIRLRKPLQYYIDKYGTPMWGLSKLFLLMEKQHNRGQDGAGLAGVKFHMPPGKPYIFRFRSTETNPIIDIIGKVNKHWERAQEHDPEMLRDAEALKQTVTPYSEVMMGHLRYGTYSSNLIGQCHPFIRENNWMNRNLVMAGNFNMTNNDQLFKKLIELGQHPTDTSDTVTVLEKVGHFLDEENERLYRHYKDQNFSREEITERIAEELDLARVLQRATRDFDGGYALEGLIGNGDAFVVRDPVGIRPAFYWQNDEVVVATSERPPIKTAFNASYDEIEELPRGHALIVKRNGQVSVDQILEPRERKACSFERIYFSRGTDRDIYRERKALGKRLTPRILKAVNYDLDHTVFSYIPNTAETAFLGLTEAVDEYLDNWKRDQLLQAEDLTPQMVEEILSKKHRFEKIAVKDVKLRTFITQDAQRDELVAHVYDTTYGILQEGKDTLVILDDSIVRGTTLRESILRILDRLGPVKIVIVSSAPQIRYPDCYGIDMSKLQDFAAFRAAISLLQEQNREDLLEEVYHQCKEQIQHPQQDPTNYVQRIYEPFTPEEVSDRIGQMLTPEGCRAEIKIIYQTIEDLHSAIPSHNGDWYFTGNYPTPGGMKVVNRAFINFYEGKNIRAY